jgi:hypothetical protein
MRRPFQYSDEDWRAIEACLVKLAPDADAHVLADCRQYIENWVDAYLYRMTHSDPRSPEQIAVKASWAKIAKHARALHAALDELEAIDPPPSCLGFSLPVGLLGRVIHASAMTPHADYLVWKKQIAEAARLAARETKGFKKSVRGSNSSRGAAVDRLFAELLKFWLHCGGHVGRASDSPSTRFVVAAVRRILPAGIKLPHAVVDFARTRNLYDQFV